MRTFDPGTENALKPESARRRFLEFLAGSPLLANVAGLGSLVTLIASESATARAQSYDILRMQTKTRKVGDIIAAPEDALDVMDFEPACPRRCRRPTMVTWPLVSTPTRRCAATRKTS